MGEGRKRCSNKFPLTLAEPLARTCTGLTSVALPILGICDAIGEPFWYIVMPFTLKPERLLVLFVSRKVCPRTTSKRRFNNSAKYFLKVHYGKVPWSGWIEQNHRHLKDATEWFLCFFISLNCPISSKQRGMSSLRDFSYLILKIWILFKRETRGWWVA